MQPDTAYANTSVFPLNSQIYRPISTKDKMPSTPPLQRPIFISFSTSSSFCLPVSDSSIRTRIVTARDCVPTFPAMSRISDWKHIIIGRFVTTFSNIPTTEETTIPNPKRMISHGILFFILSFNGSCRSSSAVRPASFA